MENAARLQHYPVTLFASVMGIGGLSLAWRRAAHVYDAPAWIGQAFFWLGLVVFAVVTAFYVAKWVRHPAAAKAELRHPIRMTFVPTITIALLVLATAGQDLLPRVAEVAWWIGAVAHLALTVVVISAWFVRSDIGLDQITPAWFIPVVGNVVTPLAAEELGNADLAWFSFGVGLVFWVALLPLLLFRLLLHPQPLPPKLMPTLAIFAAPPAVAMLSWQGLSGDVDGPGTRILYAATVMFVALVVAQYTRLRRVPFALPYWAYTFPAAAAAAAAVAMAGARPGVVYDVVAVVLLAAATLGIAAVAALTGRAVARRQICVPE